MGNAETTEATLNVKGGGAGWRPRLAGAGLSPGLRTVGVSGGLRGTFAAGSVSLCPMLVHIPWAPAPLPTANQTGRFADKHPRSSPRGVSQVGHLASLSTSSSSARKQEASWELLDFAL